jgi:hypothetical protein
MGLVVDTGNSPYAGETKLISLEVVKTRLGIEGNHDDELLNGLIDEATGLIESFVGRRLTEEAYTESIPGNARKYIVLERTPIVSLTSSIFQGDTQTDVTIYDQYAGILFRENGFTKVSSIYSHLGQDHLNGFENVDWEFNYLAGYREAGQTAAVGEFGPDFALSSLAYRSFMSLYGPRKRDTAIKSLKVDGIEETYQTDSTSDGTVGASGLPISVEKGLAQFRRWA